MSRYSENNELLKELVKSFGEDAKTKKSITREKADYAVCCLLMDISESLALIATNAERIGRRI